MPFVPQIGFVEILVLGVLILVVLGPRDLPRFAKTVGQIFAKIRAMTEEFKQAFKQMVYHEEIEAIKTDLEKFEAETEFSETDISRENLAKTGKSEKHNPPLQTETPETKEIHLKNKVSATKSTPSE